VVDPGNRRVPEDSSIPSPIPELAGVTILAEGVVQSAQPNLLLAFEASGELVEVYVQAGDQVQEGDKLVQMGGEQLLRTAESNRIKALEAITQFTYQVRDAQYELDNFTPPYFFEGLTPLEAVEAMKQAYEENQEKIKPYQSITDPEIPQTLLDAQYWTQYNYNTAVWWLEFENALEIAQSNLDRALLDLTLAEEALDGVLVAPVDGIVLSIDAATGAMVGAGSPIVTLIDTAQLEFHTTNLSERDFALISPGQKAAVTLKAYPNQPVEATVVRIGWQAGAVVGDSATFPVVLVISETDLDIRPGMTGRVEILFE
jgi:multidrug resistance efflux pump